MDWLIRTFLGAVFRRGTLRVTTASGATFTLGDGTGAPIAIRITSAATQRAILLNPELRMGEAYMDGTLLVEQGTIADLMTLGASQYFERGRPVWAKLRWLLRSATQGLGRLNRRDRARRNVAHHYDLDGRLYRLFLDDDLQYSCAYFEHPAQSLDEAQRAKVRHVAAKLLAKPGHTVLDIGSGWGGLGLYLAEMAGADVTGVTLSTEQFEVAQRRAAEKGLSDRVRFELRDYRDVDRRFDRIVSVGMFEHVGLRFYDEFFAKCASLLKDDGVMLLHAIGRIKGPSITNSWTDRYIFPGGYSPALSEVLPAIERQRLIVSDIEILRVHYAETLKAWRERFLAKRDEAEKLYDARFVRMWEFYLAGMEASFRTERGDLMVFQIQLVKRHAAAPLTRDYIGREEDRLRAAEALKAQTPTIV
jgi:cyclopropane-fatty-acyl-phospholipid synthase